MELKPPAPAIDRASRGDRAPASIDVEIGSIVVDGIAVRDSHMLREEIRRALERRLDGGETPGERTLGEQIAGQVAAAVRR